MKSSTKPFPKTKIQWLWENMEGKRALYLIGMILSGQDVTERYYITFCSLRFHIFREKLLTCF